LIVVNAHSAINLFSKNLLKLAIWPILSLIERRFTVKNLLTDELFE